MTKSEESLQKSSSETCTETTSTDFSQDDSAGLKNTGNDETSKHSSDIVAQESGDSSEKSSSDINMEAASIHLSHDSSGCKEPANVIAESSSPSEPGQVESIKSQDVSTTQDSSDNMGPKSEENPDSEISNKKISTDNESSSCPREPEIAEAIEMIDVAISKDLSDNITESAHTDEGSQPNEKAGIISETETNANPSGVNNRQGQGDNISLIITLSLSLFRTLAFQMKVMT